MELLIYLSLSMLSIEIAESSLSFKLKRLLGLAIPSKRLIGMSKLKLTGFYLFLFPIKIYSVFKLFLLELVNCPYCISFWLGLITNYFIFDLSLLYSIILAPLVTIGTLILKNIKRV